MLMIRSVCMRTSSDVMLINYISINCIVVLLINVFIIIKCLIVVLFINGFIIITCLIVILFIKLPYVDCFYHYYAYDVYCDLSFID